MNESTSKADRCSLRPCNYQAVGILTLEDGTKLRLCSMHHYIFQVVGEQKFRKKFMESLEEYADMHSEVSVR